MEIYKCVVCDKTFENMHKYILHFVKHIVTGKGQKRTTKFINN
jgi:hypothetical protein